MHGAAGHFKADLTAAFLARCAHCGAPHPMARNLATNECPDCGAAATAPSVRTVPAKLTGVRIALALMAIGRWLFSISKRF